MSRGVRFEPLLDSDVVGEWVAVSFSRPSRGSGSEYITVCVCC